MSDHAAKEAAEKAEKERADAEARAAAEEEARKKAEAENQPIPRSEFNAFYARHKATERELAAAKAKLDEQEKAKLSAEERLRKELEELRPAAERGKAAEEAIAQLVEEEAKALPPAARDLMPPNASPAEQLTWIRKAKAAGLGASPQVQTDSRKATGSNGQRLTRAMLSAMSPQERIARYEEIRDAVAANGGLLPEV